VAKKQITLNEIAEGTPIYLINSSAISKGKGLAKILYNQSKYNPHKHQTIFVARFESYTLGSSAFVDHEQALKVATRLQAKRIAQIEKHIAKLSKQLEQVKEINFKHVREIGYHPS